MKALTVMQPYPHLIAIGEKRVENRTWPTGYRGPLVIHAGLSRSWLGDPDEMKYPDMAFGAIVAVARLVACVNLVLVDSGRLPEELKWIADHEHTEGPWCWVLGDVRRIEPARPWRGERSLWEIPDDWEIANE